MKFYRGIIIRTFTSYNTVIILIAGLSQDFAAVLDLPVVIKLIGIIGNPSQFSFDAAECTLVTHNIIDPATVAYSKLVFVLAAPWVKMAIYALVKLFAWRFKLSWSKVCKVIVASLAIFL
mmetsp:Transcript_21554/g.18576  ORF Transcript_21554/g.18576 Transcript_21554/m.18576 type:complete len:120 (+) Transcript_21554:1291-1650(+)